MNTPRYIWQQEGWPGVTYAIGPVAAEVNLARRVQGVVEGKLAVLGWRERQELATDAWTEDAVATAAIEGERLDLLAVRSSVAQRLGTGGKGSGTPRQVDGLLDIMDDAVVRARDPLTHARLHAWQAALFPTGWSGMRQVATGRYRDTDAPMQIVSGPAGRETVHYEAPPSADVPRHMARLLDWLEANRRADPLVLAALAHLWFETIHPYEDGNGRVGRVIVDLALARDAGEVSRLVRISQQLLEQRDAYYAELAAAQHGGLDVTRWVAWFVTQVHAAWANASRVIDASIAKARFWAEHAHLEITARQRKAVNLLLDHAPGGFEGGMSTRKYASLTGAARATASRELTHLAQAGLLRQTGAGRSTRYEINLP